MYNIKRWFFGRGQEGVFLFFQHEGGYMNSARLDDQKKGSKSGKNSESYREESIDEYEKRRRKWRQTISSQFDGQPSRAIMHTHCD